MKRLPLLLLPLLGACSEPSPVGLQDVSVGLPALADATLDAAPARFDGAFLFPDFGVLADAAGDAGDAASSEAGPTVDAGLVDAGLIVDLGTGDGGPDAAPASLCGTTPGTVDVVAVPNEGWTEVAPGTSVEYQANPPASGGYYPEHVTQRMSAQRIEPPYWVATLRRGGLVMLYHDLEADQPPLLLRDIFTRFEDPGCPGLKRIVLAYEPDLPAAKVAVLTADHRLMADTVTLDQVQAMFQDCRDTAPLPDDCTAGTFTP